MLAVVAAAVSFNRDEQFRRQVDRHSAEQHAEREILADSDAASIRLTVSLGDWTEEVVNELIFKIKNQSIGSIAQDVRLIHDDLGPVAETQRLGPGQSFLKRVRLGNRAALLPFAVPLSQHTTLLEQQLAKTSMHFDMGHRSWVTRGPEHVRRV